MSAPTIALATRGSRRHQAIASWAALTPRTAAASARVATRVSTASSNVAAALHANFPATDETPQTKG